VSRHSVVIPSDRTTKQPVTACCFNLECLEDGDRFEFPCEHGDVACPKCGATEAPMIAVLALTHFLVRDNKAGLIRGGHGRYRLACDPKRAYLATPTNNEAATDQLEAANCPQCLRVAKEQNLKPMQGAANVGL
jgi:hypothetical protein